jgi:translation elongation factor EF-Ts
MQEGAGRSRRRPRKGRGDPAGQARQQGEQGGLAVAAEGIVAVHVADGGKTGAIVEVNSETDFVAKNEDFVRFVKDLAALVASHDPADPAALSALPLAGGTVESTRAGLVGRIGENMAIRRFARMQPPRETWRAMCTAAARSACWSMSAAARRSSHVTSRCTSQQASQRRSTPAACRPNCSRPSAASRSKRRAKPASRGDAREDRSTAPCRST